MATETTDQVVERLAIKLLDDLFGGCEYSNNPKECDKCSPSVAQIEAALREALRIGREQAAKEALAAIHNCVVNDREYFLNAIRNLSTEE